MLITEIRKLSQGSFGETMLVEREGKRYVLKRLKQSAITDHGQVAVSLFQQESEYLKELGTHAQIPALIDSGSDERGPWILQEYIRGLTLEQILDEQGAFSEDSITELLKSILPVLGYIHDHHAIHRDVKPANIIFREGTYYLVDFGASKRVSETVLAKTGTSIGTINYTAPEQFVGKATYASDIYSLGATCIHLLTGMQPFELLDLTAPGQWCWRDYLSAPVADGLARILDKMLSYSAARRYSSATQVLEDLRLIDKYEVEKRKAKELQVRKRNKAVVKWSKRIVGVAAGVSLCVGAAHVIPSVVNDIGHQMQVSSPGQESPKVAADSDHKMTGPFANMFNAIGAELSPEVRPVLEAMRDVTVIFGCITVIGGLIRVIIAIQSDEEVPSSAFVFVAIPILILISMDNVVPILLSNGSSVAVEQVRPN